MSEESSIRKAEGGRRAQGDTGSRFMRIQPNRFAPVSTPNPILRQVQIALDEFDEKPLDASVRRAVRIANLIGDRKAAIRLSMEILSLGGDRSANAAEFRRLMEDPSDFDEKDGAHEEAYREFVADRQYSGDKILAHSVSELEYFQSVLGDPTLVSEKDAPSTLEARVIGRQILARTRQRTFNLLCSWERMLTFSDTNQRIFASFQSRTEELLSKLSPEILIQFNAVYRRLNDVDQESDLNSEDLAQALVSCRRILKSVADFVHPAEVGRAEGQDVRLDDSAYRNRIKEFLNLTIRSGSERHFLEAEASGLFERFASTDKLASKGVHGSVMKRQAESCAIATYVLAGEILAIHERADKTSNGEEMPS